MFQDVFLIESLVLGRRTKIFLLGCNSIIVYYEMLRVSTENLAFYPDTNPLFALIYIGHKRFLRAYSRFRIAAD